MDCLSSPSSFSLQSTRALARVVFLTLLGIGGGWEELGARQLEEDPTWRPTAEAEARVRVALAQRWEVVPEALVLEWGRPRGDRIPEGYDHVELIGHGRDGRWVVAFRNRPGSRDARSVLLRAGVEVARPVSQRVLQRGDVIGDGDMAMALMTYWGPITDLPEACEEGWVAQRQIQAGEILAPPGVKPPLLVTSGRPVQALWSNGRVELNLNATAMGSGALGERVFVRTEAGARLDGIVRGPGLVQISNTWMESGR